MSVLLDPREHALQIDSGVSITMVKRVLEHPWFSSSMSTVNGWQVIISTAMMPGPRPVSVSSSSISTSTVGAWCNTKMASEECCNHRARSTGWSSMCRTTPVVSTGAWPANRSSVTVRRICIFMCSNKTAGSRPVVLMLGIWRSLSRTASRSRASMFMMWSLAGNKNKVS